MATVLISMWGIAIAETPNTVCEYGVREHSQPSCNFVDLENRHVAETSESGMQAVLHHCRGRDRGYRNQECQLHFDVRRTSQSRRLTGK
jgi:hypothetical protein